MKRDEDFAAAVREFAALSRADQRAILHLLSTSERRLVKRAIKDGPHAALRQKQLAHANLSAFSRPLSKHLRVLMNPRSGVSNITAATRKVLDALLADTPRLSG